MSPQPERLPEGPQPDGPQPGERAPEETQLEKTAEPRPARPDRTLLAIMVAIAVLVVVALTVVLTRGEPAPLAESTPAGVAQRYAAAAIAGDEAAAAYLTPTARNKCSAEARPVARNLRVALVSTTERPESADVKVLITVSEPGGPFGSAEYQVEDGFDLVRAGDGWLIDTVPWQLSVCPGQVKQ